MFHRRTEKQLPADRSMVGKCMVCGAVVKCLRAECQELADPCFGKALYAGCPETKRTRDGKFVVDRDGVPIKCNARVHMVQSKEDDL